MTACLQPATSLGVQRNTAGTAGSARRTYNNIFFNYSNDGGSSWLPSNSAVVVNDTGTVSVQNNLAATGGAFPGRKTAFPRMDITTTDDIFVVYQRALDPGVYGEQFSTANEVNSSDIMLAKMDSDSLKLGNAQPVRIGSIGGFGSRGGVRVDPDGNVGVSPDIAIGDDDVLHIVWFGPNLNASATGKGQVQHKTIPASQWTDVSSFGLDQDVVGAVVGSFNSQSETNLGLSQRNTARDDRLAVNLGVRSQVHLFPTVAVDRARTPDRAYVFWKHTDDVLAGGNDENIRYATSNYNGVTGAGASWTLQPEVFPTGTGFYNNSGNGAMIQQGTRWGIETYWAYVDRIAVAMDARKGDQSDVHIVFSGGESVKGTALTTTQSTVTTAGNQVNQGNANSLYYTRFNGTEWEMPQVVASANNGSQDGVPAAAGAAANGEFYKFLFEPDIAFRSGDDSIYMTFVGGSPRGVSATPIAANPTELTSGRGYGAGQDGAIAPLAFFKKLGRVVTFDDVSVPNGANVYRMAYTPTNPQTFLATISKNMVTVIAASSSDGSGIGTATPGNSTAPGGFLAGQWASLGAISLGLTSLNAADNGAIFKGAISQIQATNDNGVWEGLVDDDGASGFPEWGDNGDKGGLLVKLNVLGSDSASNLFVVASSTTSIAAKGVRTTDNLITTNPDSSSQAISIAFGQLGTTNKLTFVKGLTVTQLSFAGATLPARLDGGTDLLREATAPMGSYFQMGANISIIADNVAPVVRVTQPSSSTTGFANQSFGIKYNLFDSDDDVGTTAGATTTDSLQMELYFYPDNGLTNVRDIRTFGTLIVDENDAFTAAATNAGTGDFTEGTSSTNEQTYTWDDPGVTLQNAFGWAPITKTLDGTFFIYIVADDKNNPPVFDVSDGSVRIRHIPLVNSIKPVSVDTVDTGEFVNLDKVNPYNVVFDLIDFDDNAQVRLFFSTTSGLNASNVTVTGTFPNQTLQLASATEIQLSDTLRTDDDVEFDFDVTAQGASGDSVIAQNSYFIYAVVADDDTFAVGQSNVALAVRHSPAFEFTAPLLGTVRKLNTTQQFQYTVEWQRGRSDQDLDGNAIISLYYSPIDPAKKDFSGTDSTRLVATSGADSGAAVLIQGNIREDLEGAGDQFVWSFVNPPGELPRTYRNPTDRNAVPAAQYSPHSYQHGATNDTAWVYAVLHDSLGNTRVQSGGAVLLLGSQESPASQTPRVIMKTPPSGDHTMVNGDVVRLEWDAFLIDDGTGTDDAYLRLYAAPKGSFSTLTDLEKNNLADGGTVFLINSLTGRDDAGTSILTLRESDPKFFNWDTKTTSFEITGTPTEFDIFIAASMDPEFGDNVYVNAQVDSIASGIGSEAQKAVLSKSPGVLRVEGVDPIFSIELSPGSLTASSGDTLDLDVLANSQGSSTDLMSFHLNVPRNYFSVVDQDTATAGLQPFADSTGAFQGASTIAQNDTTGGTAQWLKLNFVESSLNGEVLGRVASPFDSSQVAGRLQLVVNRFNAGAPLDTLLQWSSESGRKTAFYRGTTELAAPARNGQIILTPRARLIVTVPLEGRTDYADTMDAHLRDIGSTQDIVDQTFITSNDVTPVFVGGGSSTTLEDSVNVVTDIFGTFQLLEIPPGVYELTMKAPGYVTGRSDTLTLFNGLTQAIEPTFGSDALGDLSPATPLGELRGGDATGDNQVDIADANLMFSLWNLTPSDAGFVRDADVNDDGVINALDLGFVTKNFGNDGFGAPPVFKRITEGGDNSDALVKVEGIEEVEAWWPGRVFEVTARIEGMNDVAVYGLRMTYDPERVKPLAGEQAVTQGDIFDENPEGSLFFHRRLAGAIDIASGRLGADWSASGDAALVTVRFATLTDEPGVIDVAYGDLGNSAHIGVAMQVEKVKALPKAVALHQNYPNPFNPATEIRFDLPTARDVKLRIYNQLGQTIRTLVDHRLKAGAYSLKWNGADEQGNGVASGVYFYNLEAGDFAQIRKMTLVK